jgi:hypothetical protein
MDHYSIFRVSHRSVKGVYGDKQRDDEMADSFQNKVSKAGINLQLDLRTGGVKKEPRAGI